MYEEYIKILENHNIKDARIKMEDMYILDFLIMNEDRHLNNFGIIRDVNTLKWLDVAPIFDNGQSLNIEYYDEEEMHISGEGKLFYEVKSFDELIKVAEEEKIFKQIYKFLSSFIKLDTSDKHNEALSHRALISMESMFNNKKLNLEFKFNK